MKIRIEEGKNGFSLIIPTSLIFNSISFRLANKYMKDSESKYIKGGASLKLKPNKAKEIRRCIKNLRKIHTNWSLVEVYDEDESYVNIKL